MMPNTKEMYLGFLKKVIQNSIFLYLDNNLVSPNWPKTEKG